MIPCEEYALVILVMKLLEIVDVVNYKRWLV